MYASRPQGVRGALLYASGHVRYYLSLCTLGRRRVQAPDAGCQLLACPQIVFPVGKPTPVKLAK